MHYPGILSLNQEKRSLKWIKLEIMTVKIIELLNKSKERIKNNFKFFLRLLYLRTIWMRSIFAFSSLKLIASFIRFEPNRRLFIKIKGNTNQQVSKINPVVSTIKFCVFEVKRLFFSNNLLIFANNQTLKLLNSKNLNPFHLKKRSK